MSNEQLDSQFVKNVEEESEEEDEFDKAIHEQYQKHLEEKEENYKPDYKQNMRPESGKPARSGNFYQGDINEEDEDKEQKQQIEALWKKGENNNNNFENLIKLQQVPKTLGNDLVVVVYCVLRSYLSQINFLLLDEEFNSLCKLVKNKENWISVESLSKVVDAWKNNTNFMLDFLKEKSLKIVQKSNKKKNLPPSSQTAYYQRPISGISQGTFKSKQSGYTDFKFAQIPPIKQYQNNSKKYLQKHKEKEQEQERLLALTINRGKNEYEYECLIKMGHANELSQQLSSKTTYRAYKSADGNLKVHIYNLDQFVDELTLEDFQREYNKLKNRYTSNKKLKVWELPTEGKDKGGKLKTAEEEKADEETAGKQINKKERLTDLRQVLLETMMLTNILKEQLAVLNKKGINCQPQNFVSGNKSNQKSNYNASQF